MTTTVFRQGASVRVVISPRSIIDTEINEAGHLIVYFSDGTQDDAGYVGGGGGGAVALGNLTLSGALQIGLATSGTVLGGAVGSVITDNIPGITVDNNTRTYSGTPSGSAGAIANGLVETLPGAIGSPRSSSVTVNAALNLGTLSLSNAMFAIGTPESGTIIGATGGSTINATGLPTGLTINGVARTFAYDGTGTDAITNITLTETLTGYGNSPKPNIISVTIEDDSITAPTLTKTSGSGVNPLGFSITVDGTVSAGMYWRLQVAGNSGFTTPLAGEGTIRENYQMILAGDFVDGPSFSALSAMPDGIAYARLQVESDGGNISPWSNVVSDTLATTAVLSDVTGVDKASGVDVTGTPKLIATNNGGSNGQVRTTKQVVGKRHWEATINTINSAVLIILTEATVDLSGFTPLFYIQFVAGDSNASIFANGSLGSSSIGAPAVGDTIVTELDKATGAIKVWRNRSGVDLLVVDTILTSLPPLVTPVFAVSGAGTQITTNFGATTFVKALTSGYSAL